MEKKSFFIRGPIEDAEILEKERVDHPAYYQQGIEPIEVIESWDLNFNLGNVIKYTLRAPYKENMIQDLEKAKWYLERELQRLKK